MQCKRETPPVPRISSAFSISESVETPLDTMTGTGVSFNADCRARNSERRFKSG